ncbi:hypothetical protein BGZ76_009768 [Entomortierella beljakovae]|nr:hypothetical protein BGZ76_009768 [Entomortierella beljakovae]
MVKSSSAPYCFVSGKTDITKLASSSKYLLVIRQQPRQAKVCGSKDRDRRPIDPPPIIQIKLSDPTSDRNRDYLQSPYLFMCCNIVHAADPNGEIVAPAHRALAGTVVSSLNRLKDVDNSDGGFFVFGDMSVRMEGNFCLRFTLFELVEGQVVHVMTTLSSPFTVHTSKTFPGLSESTFLSRSFSDQGVRIRIRKDHHVKPKKSITSDTADSSMHSPASSCHDAEHSDNDVDMSHSNKRSRPSVHSHDETMYPSQSKVVGASYPSDSYNYSPPTSPRHNVDQDNTPSRPHYNPYGGEEASRYYHAYSRSYRHEHAPAPYPHSYGGYHAGSPRAYPYPPDGRRSSISSYPHDRSYYREGSPSYHHSSVYNSTYSHYHSSAPMHAGHHGFPSSSLNDQDGEYYQRAYHSRTPSMSSQHSDGNFSPPHPFSPKEAQTTQANSPSSPTFSLPLILPSLSRSSPGDKIQLPSIRALSTTTPLVSETRH